MDLISIKMLKMNYRHRKSTSDCLKKMYRLGFHEIQIVDIEFTTSMRKMTDRDDVTKNKSVITQPLQHSLSNKNVSSGFYDIKKISESIEIVPSKRDLRDETHFYNRAF